MLKGGCLSILSHQRHVQFCLIWADIVHFPFNSLTLWCHQTGTTRGGLLLPARERSSCSSTAVPYQWGKPVQLWCLKLILSHLKPWRHHHSHMLPATCTLDRNVFFLKRPGGTFKLRSLLEGRAMLPKAIIRAPFLILFFSFWVKVELNSLTW